MKQDWKYRKRVLMSKPEANHWACIQAYELLRDIDPENFEFCEDEDERNIDRKIEGWKQLLRELYRRGYKLKKQWR